MDPYHLYGLNRTRIKMFIDTTRADQPHAVYPFYAYDQDFCDAPLWTYTVFNKPIRFWKGHAFAVQVDHKRKTIRCIGRIEWGLELHFTKIRPKAINPRILSEHDWTQAWSILKEKLPGYKQIQAGKL